MQITSGDDEDDESLFQDLYPSPTRDVFGAQEAYPEASSPARHGSMRCLVAGRRVVEALCRVAGRRVVEALILYHLHFYDF